MPVIVELGEETIRLSASGTEIGEWPTDECDITKESDSTYLIHAEAESLAFTPTQSGAFAAAVGLANEKAVVPLPPEPGPVVHADVAPNMTNAPAPRPMTVGLFYGLCAVTLGLGMWALISIAF